jgi:hypothetical protein
MAEWFGNFLLVNIIWITFGIWALRKLLKEHPILGKGLMTVFKRFFF